MIDARISVALPSHPKTKKLIKISGTDAAWRLVCLFLWAAQNRPDGVLSGMDAEDIELAVDWPGDDGAFVESLTRVGFLDDDDGQFVIHDWHEHNPWAAGANRRSEVARQNALKKWGGGSLSDNAKTRSQRLAEARQKGKHTTEEWEAMKSVCGDACVKCGTAELDLSKDHIVPICKGGSDGIENIQPMCHRCNAGKGGSDSADLRPNNWSDLLAERLQNACKTPATFVETPAPSPSPSPSLTPSPKEKEQTIVASKLASCPHQEIISIFSEILPELPQPRVWDGAREKNLSNRWKWVLADLKKRGRPCDKDAGIEFFRRMFAYIAKCDFLMGKRKDWACSLPWIVEAENFAKIIEGNFEPKEPA